MAGDNTDRETFFCRVDGREGKRKGRERDGGGDGGSRLEGRGGGLRES
jgi:hypothetical protein